MGVESQIFFLKTILEKTWMITDPASITKSPAMIGKTTTESVKNATTAMVEAHPRTVKAFRDATLKGLAYALDHGPNLSRWVLSVRGGQAFSIFNSATRRLRRPPTSRLDEISPPGFPEPR